MTQKLGHSILYRLRRFCILICTRQFRTVCQYIIILIYILYIYIYIYIYIKILFFSLPRVHYSSWFFTSFSHGDVNNYVILLTECTMSNSNPICKQSTIIALIINVSLLGNNMKKCRARYGLDQQSQWCKPCRYVYHVQSFFSIYLVL